MKGPTRKKILIVISSDLFVRNYIKNDAFKLIEEQYDCYFAASSNVTMRTELEKKANFLGYYAIDADSANKYMRLFNVTMWKNRKKSSSFLYRYYRFSCISLLLGCHDLCLLAKNFLKFLYNNIFVTRWPLKTLILGNAIFFERFYTRYLSSIEVNNNLRNLICNTTPDVIIFPSSAYDPDGSDIIRIAEDGPYKTLFLIDNWDNLSSKTVFWKKPDFLGVWGEQSKEHAMQIHGFKPDRVYCIGTPRFDDYYYYRQRNLESHFPFRYILFVGCAIPYDETTILQKLDDFIEREKDLFCGTRIVYRPHPWRHKRLKEKSFRESDFRHTVIDPQVKSAYYREIEVDGSGKGFQPDLNYYPSLLQNARFVIGPLTTMLIEALIFGKRVIALSMKDFIHFTSPYYAHRYFKHFDGLEAIESINICGDFCEVKEAIARILKSCSGTELERSSVDPVSSELKYFIYNDERKYQQRLLDVTIKTARGNQWIS